MMPVGWWSVYGLDRPAGSATGRVGVGRPDRGRRDRVKAARRANRARR